VKKRERRGIQSVDTGMRLLEVLEKADGPLALKDLSAAAELDPSSAHRYLASFARVGLVRQEADSRYDFGPLALHIGLAAIRRLDPVQLTERALPELVAQTGFTALLSVWSNRGPTVVHWERSRTPFVTNLGLGSVLPIAPSATGTVLVAFLPAGVTADAIDAEAKQRTVDRAAFERAVERARKTRLARAAVERRGGRRSDAHRPRSRACQADPRRSARAARFLPAPVPRVRRPRPESRLI
jgi:DNA-binding IclR family transcriptional regulator